jgi:hypothetical protein
MESKIYLGNFLIITDFGEPRVQGSKAFYCTFRIGNWELGIGNWRLKMRNKK